ncbi:MAG: CBS domain-containing protein [Campylobacterales bacterium]
MGISVGQIVNTQGVALGKTATLAEALACVRGGKSGCACLVDNQKATAIVTERDLVRALAGEALETQPAALFATPKPIAVEADRSVEYALHLMIGRNIRRLVVTRSDSFIGVVTQRDLIATLESDLYKTRLRAIHLVTQRRELVFAQADWPLREALQMMVRHGISDVLVQNGAGLAGIVTETDVLKIEPSRIKALKVGDVMSSPVVTARENELVETLVETMRKRKIHHIAIVDESQQAVGVITERDILRNLESSYSDFLESRLRYAKASLEHFIQPIVDLVDEGGESLIEWANRKAVELFGDGLVDSPVHKLIGKRAWTRISAKVAAGQAVENERVTIARRHFDLSVSPVDPGRRQLLFHDVTEYEQLTRKYQNRLAEKNELKRSIERERNLFLSGPTVVFRWKNTAGWPVEYVSPNIRQLLGYIPADLTTGRVPFADVVHPDDVKRVADEVVEYTRLHRDHFEQRYRLITQDGRVIWIHDVTAIVRDAEGNATHYDGYVNDVTDRVLGEQQLREQMEQKEQMLIQQSKMAAMGEMIGAIAHQWRQPLSSLSLIAQDLVDAQKYGELDDSYLQHGVDRIQTQIAYMSQTINDFRDFLKPNKAREPFSPYRAAKAVVELLGVQLAAHGVQTGVEADEASGTIKAVGNENEFKQVMVNLINNAKEAVIERQKKEAGFKGFIRIEVAARKGGVALLIIDNGGGIPAWAQPRIFQPYFTTKGSDKGTGIGLYMAKSIIESGMGGTLSFASTPNEGTVFTLTLPAV